MASLDPTMTALAGGHSGRTFLGDVGGERAVVRLYPPDDPRGESAPEVDEAVLRLVRGLLPVPDVLEVRRAHPPTSAPGLLVTSWLPGERADLAHARLVRAGDEDGLARMGRALGTVAATLAGMPTLRSGPFRDADLTIGRFPDDGLVEWVDARLAHWPAPVRAALAEVAAPAQDLLDGVGRTCVVHSDLNPKNVLVDPGTLDVVGVLDWEYAHSGHPWTDLGNVVRFERQPAYVDSALEAWCELRGGDPADLVAGARAADLWALVDLAARAGANPVADRAARLLEAIASEGDVHARPEVL